MHHVSLFDILIFKGPIVSHVEDDVTRPLGFLSGVFLLGGAPPEKKFFGGTGFFGKVLAFKKALKREKD